MDSHGNLDSSSQEGWSLLWIDAILLVPAIFGALFLPPTPRLIVLGGGLALAAIGGFLYSRK